MTLYFSDGPPSQEAKLVGDVDIDLAAAGVDSVRQVVHSKSIGVKQVETATVLGSIGAAGQGNAAVTVTATGMTGSPKTIQVPVANNDTAAQVAAKIAAALDADPDFDDLFDCVAQGANVIATAKDEAANIANFNIAIDNGTCSGLTAAPTSTSTTAGVEEAWVAAPVCHAQIRRGYGLPAATHGFQEGDLFHELGEDKWYRKAGGAWGDAAVTIA